MIRRIFFIFPLFSLIFVACTSNRLDVDVSKVKVSISYVNLDSLLVNSDTSNLQSILQPYANTSDCVLAYQLGHCLGIGGFKDYESKARISMFKQDPYIKRLEKEIGSQFVSKSKYQYEINEGFKHLSFHFSAAKVPRTIFYINSLFVSNVYCSSSEIGIGLERYLGAHSSVIKELPQEEFFQWMKEGMRKEFISRDVLFEWISTQLVPETEGNFAQKMIRLGKVLYVTEAAYPTIHKPILFRYSQKGYDWAVHNEASIWKYLVNEELLFSKNERDHANFLAEGPFTVGLPENSPDRLGQYLGWRIVSEFMKKNESISVKELVNIPYNTILQSYEIEE